MTNYIEIGGKKRPARFNNAGMLEYEQQTDRRILADIAGFNDAGGLSMTVIVDLVFYGLVCGHRKTKENVDFDKFDVAEWIEETPGLVQTVIEGYSKAIENSFAGNVKTGKPGKKPATPTP